MLMAKQADRKSLLNEISVLSDDFIKNEHQPKSERDICRVYVEPLFAQLGWNFRDLNEVKEQVNQPDGRPDYIVYLNGSIAFYLETKKVQELSEKDLTQAVNYGRSKNKRWAVLSNFKETIILICDIKETSIQKHIFRRIHYSELESRLDDLLLLSKESFQTGLIEKKAQDEGRVKKTVKIDDELLNDIWGWRQKLINSIKKNNSKEYSKEQLEEIVQTLLNRIIFIRTVEDRKHEARPDETIRAILNQYEKDKSISIREHLNKVFKEYDEIYDSKLFTYDETNIQKKHECERVEIDSATYYKILKETYDKDDIYSYHFNDIDADILGSMYELYIGRIQSTRKEHGIYYTPKQVVDYIVKNTLGELLKTKKLADAEEIKVLDMACGSGSFLLGAFDTLDDYYKNHDKNYSQSKLDSETDAARITRKTRILKNNIYGVDLDSKAVEITQLNLLLWAAEAKHRLPSLQKNIKCGNSLIDDDAIVGDKAFRWEEQFAAIIKDGGFDIIIGNPPYGADLKEEELKFLEKFKTSSIRNYDTYIFFIENAIKLLKEDGFFGFIVPDTFLRKSDLLALREVILANFKVRSIAEVGAVFGDAKVTENVIFIFQKCSSETERVKNVVIHRTLDKDQSRETRLSLISRNIWQSEGKIRQKIWVNSPEMRLGRFNRPELLAIIEKIEKGKLIKDIPEIEISRGSEGGKDQIAETQLKANYRPIIIPDDIWKYGLKFNNRFFPIKDVTEKYQNEKLLIVRIRNTRIKDRIVATYDNTGLFTLKTLQIINLKNNSNLSLKYLLALLNSTLMNFYCQHYLSDDINKKYIQGLKIIISREDIPIVEKLVEKMLSLNKKLGELTDTNMIETTKLDEEIDKTNTQINDIVYKIYGVTYGKKLIEDLLRK